MKTIAQFTAHLNSQIAETTVIEQELKKFEDAERVAEFERDLMADEIKWPEADVMNAVRFAQNAQLQERLNESLSNVRSLFYAPVGTTIRLKPGKELTSPCGFHPDDRVFQIVNK